MVAVKQPFYQTETTASNKCAKDNLRYPNRGFSEWGEVFGDNVVAAALLDRLLHHAIVIEIAGNSYRLREHAKLVPENLRLPPITAPVKPKKRRGRPPKRKSSE